MNAFFRRIFLRRWWTVLFFTPALIGFVASLVVHFGTFFKSHNNSATPEVYLLHAFCMVMFFLTFPFSRQMEKLWGHRVRFDKDYGGRNGQRIIHVLFFYAIINFILFLGMAVAKGHMRVWQSGPSFHARGWGGDREISEEEYHQHRVHELRGFSGHWMLFFAMPALFFLHLKPVDLFEPEPEPPKQRRGAKAAGKRNTEVDG